MNTKTTKRIAWMATVLLGLSVVPFVAAQEMNPDERSPFQPETDENAMTAARLGELIVNVDENAELNASTWFFEVAGLEAVVVYDTNANRMRIVIPIGPVEHIEKDELMRLMQANFDSALDARYAIANDTLWGTFIHPLSTLTDEDFLVGIGQTVNVVKSYGTSYSSGLFTFGSGDSAQIERERLIEELKKHSTT